MGDQAESLLLEYYFSKKNNAKKSYAICEMLQIFALNKLKILTTKNTVQSNCVSHYRNTVGYLKVTMNLQSPVAVWLGKEASLKADDEFSCSSVRSV